MEETKLSSDPQRGPPGLSWQCFSFGCHGGGFISTPSCFSSWSVPRGQGASRFSDNCPSLSPYFLQIDLIDSGGGPKLRELLFQSGGWQGGAGGVGMCLGPGSCLHVLPLSRCNIPLQPPKLSVPKRGGSRKAFRDQVRLV